MGKALFILMLVILAVGSSALPAAGGPPGPPSGEQELMQYMLAGGGIVGWGRGESGNVIFVKDESVALPVSLVRAGYEVLVTGQFYRLDQLQGDSPLASGPTGLDERQRPIFPGLSLSHYLVSAGTFGALVFDEGGRRLMLSANHVLANSDGASVGDAILQPGAWDGGTPALDTVARLTRWINIRRCNRFDYENSTCPLNSVDAAVAAIEEHVEALDHEPHDPAGAAPSGVTAAYPGQRVYKIGRTTGLTYARVYAVDATVLVCCYSGMLAAFSDQIVTDVMAWGGDSGSLLREQGSGNAVGLLFAGSAFTTVHNDISKVMQALCVSFDRQNAGLCRRMFFPLIISGPVGEGE